MFYFEGKKKKREKMNLFNASTILCNAIVDTFERSNNNVCKERFTCKDLAKRLIPKSPTSFPLISSSFNVVHAPIKLIKSVKFVFNLQSVKYRLSNFEYLNVISFISEFMIGLRYLKEEKKTHVSFVSRRTV
jgi:hypothetical protein